MRLLDDRDDRPAEMVQRDVRAGRPRGRRHHLRRALGARCAGPGGPRGAGGPGAGRARCDRRSGGRVAGRADRPAGAPPGARALAPHRRVAPRDRPLRRAARPRLHDVRPHARGVGPVRHDAGARRPGAGRGGRAGLRIRAAAACGGPRTVRRDARGNRACATMAERPAILRGFRLADATALLVCALALAAAPASAASRTKVAAASDPSAAGGAVVYEKSGAGVLLRDGTESPLPGHDPALGGGYVAWLSGNQVTIATAATLAPAVIFDAPGADAVAVSSTWIVWRTASARRRRPAVGRARQRPLARRARRGDERRDPGRAAQPRRRHGGLRDSGRAAARGSSRSTSTRASRAPCAAGTSA